MLIAAHFLEIINHFQLILGRHFIQFFLNLQHFLFLNLFHHFLSLGGQLFLQAAEELQIFQGLELIARLFLEGGGNPFRDFVFILEFGHDVAKSL